MKKYLSLIALLPLLAGCSGDPIALDESEPYSRDDFKNAALEISYSTDESMDNSLNYVSYTLTCSLNGNAEGTHPKAEESCAHLKANPEIFQTNKNDENQICTMIYGGPQKATITGEINDEEVSFKLDRRDGCAISVWDSWGPILSLGEPGSLATVN